MPGPLGTRTNSPVIDQGTNNRDASRGPGPYDRAPIAMWSRTDRLAEAIRCAVRYMPGEAGGRLIALLSPAALGIMATVLVAWLASHAIGIGEAADAVMLIGGILFLGRDAFEAATLLYHFADRALNGATEADFDEAGRDLARAVAIIGIDAVIALLTHQSIKLIKGQYRPTTTGDPTLPPGQGSTNKFGDIEYSTAGTAEDQRLVLYHEQVHQFLSPKIAPLRNFRADLNMAGYNQSSLLRYVEEALAESYAQMRVNGLKGLPVGLRFPIANGYVTVSAVATEAGILVGTVVVGGVAYRVILNLSGP